MCVSSRIEDTAFAFNSPATDNDILKLEQSIQRSIPDSLRQFLSIHNGEDRNGTRTLGMDRFLSCAEMVKEWKNYSSLDENTLKAKQKFDARLSQGLYWRREWLFIAENGPDKLLMSCDGSAHPYIFEFHHEVKPKQIIATSVFELFERALKMTASETCMRLPNGLFFQFTAVN